MAGFSALVRYLRLKVLVTFSRFLLKFVTPSTAPKHDYLLEIPSRDQHRTIKIHVYKPVEQKDASDSTPVPVLINLCGTGFTIPFHGVDDDFCRRVAKATGHEVLDVDYRLAPEYPFPAAVNDVEDTVQYVLSHPKKYQISQISISGFSSGGTLALSACTTLPRRTFQSLIAFYPATDLFLDSSLREAPAIGEKKRSPFWTRVFRESYIRDMDPRDPRISPAFADSSNFPANMLFVTGELDVSAIEAEQLAAKAKQDANKGDREVILRRMKGCGHAFDKKTKGELFLSARDEAYELAINMLKKLLGAST